MGNPGIKVVHYSITFFSSEAPPPKSKIYTRTGDKGSTSLFSGSRVPKTHSLIETLGNTDELSSCIGVALEYCRRQPNLGSLCEQLVYIQCRLQELNSHVATPGGDKKPTVIFDEGGVATKQVERWIDEMDNQLPPLKMFVLPVRKFSITS